MRKMVRGYRKISRYSTLVLLTLTIGLGLYAWFSRSQVYYERYCEDPSNSDVSVFYRNSYECDQSLIQNRLQSERSCKIMGCRRVIK